MKSRGLIALALAGAVALAMPIAAQAQSQKSLVDVRMIGFGGANNLITWIAIDKGLFAKQGLNVTLDVTPGSREQMQNMMSGKYHFATTAFDNIIAYTEGQGRDDLPGLRHRRHHGRAQRLQQRGRPAGDQELRRHQGQGAGGRQPEVGLRDDDVRDHQAQDGHGAGQGLQDPAGRRHRRARQGAEGRHGRDRGDLLARRSAA